MKKFLLNITIFFFLIGISIYAVCYMANGYTDPFYLRFTSPKQNALILGTSRAAQGLQPEILNETLINNSSDLFNFSFTIAHSPYGPTYLKSIERKLNKGTKGGMFIVTVDPWSICANSKFPNDASRFGEVNKFLASTKFVNMNPNIPYLLESFTDRNYRIIRRNSPLILHEDGWLEVSPNMAESRVTSRTNAKIKDYQQRKEQVIFSEVRFDYLKQTIALLKEHGSVYLVRLPIHPRLMNIENELMPNFSIKMKQLAEKNQINYFDMTWSNSDYQYTDGNHLYKDSGSEVSLKIAYWINSIRKH